MRSGRTEAVPATVEVQQMPVRGSRSGFDPDGRHSTHRDVTLEFGARERKGNPVHRPALLLDGGVGVLYDCPQLLAKDGCAVAHDSIVAQMMTVAQPCWPGHGHRLTSKSLLSDQRVRDGCDPVRVPPPGGHRAGQRAVPVPDDHPG